MTINNKIRVTNFASVNSINFSTRASTTNPTGWSTFKTNEAILGSATGTFIATGLQSSSTALTKLLRSTDFVTWSEITIPATIFPTLNGEYTRTVCTNNTGTWIGISGDPGNFVSDNKTIKSTDDGATWSAGGNLPSSTRWGAVESNGSGTFMTVAENGSVAITTNSGTTWSAATTNSVGRGLLKYGGGRWLTIASSSGTTIQHSDNNGTTWSATRTCPQMNQIHYIGGKFIGFGVPTASVPGIIYMSSDLGVTWSAVASTTTGGSISNILIANSRYYINHSNKLYSSTDLVNWVAVNELTGDTNIVNTASDVLTGYTLPLRSVESTILTYIPVITNNSTTGIYYSKGTPTINNGNSSYIDVTASKGSMSRVIRVPVVKDTFSAAISSMSVYPSSYGLAATVDGVVAADAYTNANITVTVYTNGIDTTSQWVLNKSDSSGLSTTLTGSNIKVNSLATANDTGTCDVTATNATTSKALTTRITITKNKDSSISGINRGASFSAYSTTQTAVYLKFLTTGYFQIKYGSGGTYANAGQWYTPVNVASPQGGNYYMIMEYTSFTGETLNAGTNGVVGGSTWNQMNVDREYHLTNAVSGRHVIDVNPRFATSNTGANANVGSGRLELNVP